MKCQQCNSDKNLITLTSTKKTIHICQSCFDFKNRGIKLIKGHGYNLTTIPKGGGEE